MFMIMLGFTFFSASMWVGQEMAAGLDFWGFIKALLLGGAILGIYTGLLGYVGAETGLSLDLLSKRAFGEKGSYISSALTSFTQIGWFGVGIAMFAIPVARELFGGSTAVEWVLILIAGACMTASAYFGIKSLTVISYIAVPLVAILGTVAMIMAIKQGDGTIVDQFAKSSGSLSVIGGAGLAIGSFVSGGTATPNFTRFAKNGKQGTIATVVAFFIGNSLMFFFGAISYIFVGGNDIFEVMIRLNLFYLAILVLGLNIWTTNDNALYTAGLNLDPTKGWDYDDYFDAVAKLTNKDEKHYGASYRGARGALDPLLVYLQSFTDGNTYDQEGNIQINSDECLEAFKKWTDVYLNGYAPEDAINWGFTEMVDNFTGGLTGTLINDSEVLPTCAQNMEEGTWGVMPMPKSTKDGKIYNTINAPYAYSISGNSENPDEAWKLIEFMTNAENNFEYCKLTGEIPIKKDVENDDTYGTDGPYAAFVEQMNDPDLAVPTTFGPFDYTDLHQGMFHEEIQKYLLGDEDAETALTTITDELQSRMKQFIEENPDTKVETALTLK